MSTELPEDVPESDSKKRAAVRPWFVVGFLSLAVVITWFAWPSKPPGDPYELSRADGRSRFYATTYSKRVPAPGISLPQRLLWAWTDFQRRHSKPNSAAYTFPASPVQPTSVQALFQQCMEVTGTQYLIAVEVTGVIEFGHTNALNGVQWVAAVEQAVGSSNLVVCYDYAKKRNFQDTLLLIRERPGVVKIVPRTKLTEYERAGLVGVGSR